MAQLESLPFPDASSLPTELQEELARRKFRHVFRMLMHTPRVAPSFLTFTDALRGENSLNGVWREIVILRVGHRYEAPYEVHHHERIGRAEGMTEAQIAGVKVGSGDPRLTAEEQQLIKLTDELVDQRGLSATSREEALSFLTPTQLADFVLLVGYYQMVCNYLNVFGIKVEPSNA